MSLTKKPVLIGLCIALVLQLSVLIGELVVAASPQWFGKPIQVRAYPVDPRDLFRGNYARLSYDFSDVDAMLWAGEQAPRRDQVVYLQLQQDDNQDWHAAALLPQAPGAGVFLRGRFRRVISAPMVRVEEGDTVGWRKSDQPDRYHIEYGVEAWFAPKHKAQAIEQQLRDGAMATLYVADSGRAALVAIDQLPETH